MAVVHHLSETPEELEATIMSPLWVPIVKLELLTSDSAYITISVTEGAPGEGIGLPAFAERFRGPQGTSVIMADHDVRSLGFFERHGYAGVARRPNIKDGRETPGIGWLLLRKPQPRCRGQSARRWQYPQLAGSPG